MSGALFLLCLVSFVLFGGIYYITPHLYNSLSENLATALIGTGDCGAQKQIIAVNNIQTMEYICMSLNMFNNPSKTAFRILNFDLMNLSHFPGLHFLRRQLSWHNCLKLEIRITGHVTLILNKFDITSPTPTREHRGFQWDFSDD